jgi:hypothetical protein
VEAGTVQFFILCSNAFDAALTLLIEPRNMLFLKEKMENLDAEI